MNPPLLQSRLTIKFIWLVDVVCICASFFLLWHIFTAEDKKESPSWQAPITDAAIVTNTMGTLESYIKAASILLPVAVEIDTPVKLPSLEIPTKSVLVSAESIFKLKGTLVDSVLSVAFLEILAEQKQKAVYEGDTIKGFKIEAIEAGLIRLSKDGKKVAPMSVAKVSIEMNAQTSSKTASLPGKASQKIDKSDVQKLLKEPTNLLRDVSFTPKVNRSGKIEGMKITRIARASIFAKRGIRVGDIVTNINGKATTGIAAGMSLLTDLNDADKIVIRLKRHGRLKTFTFNVE